MSKIPTTHWQRTFLFLLVVGISIGMRQSSAGATSVTAAANPSVTAYADFPHIGLYGTYRTSGWPLVGLPGSTTAGPTDPLNENVMNGFARHEVVILPLTPGADARPDILTSLRSRNPSIRLFGYVLGYQVFCPDDGTGHVAYSPSTYSGAIYLAVTGGDTTCGTTTNRFLWLQNGTKPEALNINVNLAHRILNPDSSYTYDVAEAVATTMYEYSRPGRHWDGLEIDVFCGSIIWTESPGVVFDYARAGYGNDNANPANRAAFDAGWQAGHARLHQKLRELATADGYPDFPIIGNCGRGPTAAQSTMHGWMRENFPYLEGGTFYSNLTAWPGGYLNEDHLYRAPQENFLNTAPIQDGADPLEPTSSFNPRSATNQRRMRFGLAAASMGNGTSIFNLQDTAPSSGSWWNWWFDEYGVQTNVLQTDPTYGTAATGAQFLGWLGQPRSPAYQMLGDAFSSTTNLITHNLSFETSTGSPTTLANWTLFLQGGSASLERDVTTSADGVAAAKITVTTSDPDHSYAVQLVHDEFFPVTQGQQYAVSFKAKASVSAPISPVFAFGPSGAGQTLWVDTVWRQYQAILVSGNSDPDAILRFELGLQAGTYWIDDVHIQPLATALWRRDFEKGTVLVNPSAGPVTVTLEEPYRHISGTINPALNDGASVTSVTLSGTNAAAGIGDAVFLLRIDATPPSAVTDLHPSP